MEDGVIAAIAPLSAVGADGVQTELPWVLGFPLLDAVFPSAG